MGHMKVQQEQVGLELPIELQHQPGVPKAFHIGVSSRGQDSFQQANVRFLIVDDQDLSVGVFSAKHGVTLRSLEVRTWFSEAAHSPAAWSNNFGRPWLTTARLARR